MKQIIIIIGLIFIIILCSFLFTSKYENFNNPNYPIGGNETNPDLSNKIYVYRRRPSYPIGGDTTNPDLSNKTNQYNVNIYVSFIQYILLIIIIIIFLSLWKR